MKFLCCKLEDVDGHLVAYAQILPYSQDPEVLFWGGRVFRLKNPGVSDADLPVEDVPGLVGPRKVVHYVEAFSAAAIATVMPDGSIVRATHGNPALHEPEIGDRSSLEGVLSMYVSDGSSIFVDSISGGADSTDGVPNGLTLVLRAPDGQERRERYLAESSLLTSPATSAILHVWQSSWADLPPSLVRLGDLAAAAACYAMPDSSRDYAPVGAARVEGSAPMGWPWDDEDWSPSPEDRRAELLKAGAMVLAEIRQMDIEARR